MKILIAYDGSSYADSAIDDLKWAGLPSEGEAVVLTVTNVWESSISPIIVDRVSTQTERQIRPSMDEFRKHQAEALENAQALAQSGAEQFRQMFPGWSVSAETCVGKPAWKIIESADKWKANLVVVGSHGRSAIGRMILGSVSQKILYESRCSVRISRQRITKEEMPLRVLVAVDGSKFAEFAVKTVAARKWSPKTEFRIITADDDPFSRPEVSLIDDMPEGTEDSEAAKIWIKTVIKSPAEIFESAGLHPTQFVRWGEARNVILNEAEDWKADSIFVGARGLGHFKRFLLGSVSAAIASRSKCSVEIIRIEE